MARKPYWATAGLLTAAVLIVFIVRSIAADHHLTPGVAGSAAVPVEAVSQSAPQQSAPPLRISAAQLYAEYDENAVAANDEFAGRVLEVSGKILSINKESSGGIRLRIGVDQYGFDDIEAQIADGDEPTASFLAKGHAVTLVCKDVHRELGSVALDHCSLPPID